MANERPRMRSALGGERSITAWPLAVAVALPCLTLVWLVARLPVEEQFVMSRRVVLAVCAIPVCIAASWIIKALAWAVARVRETRAAPPAPVVERRKRSTGKAEPEMNVIDGRSHARRRTLG